MISETTTPTPRRSWLRPRYSLRVFMLAVTAFAIGFPIWYRWPYEEREQLMGRIGLPNLYRVTTWQRQWGGGRVKHGPLRYVNDGKTISTTTYQNGMRQGAFEETDLHGNRTTGSFDHDQPHGVWTISGGGQKIVQTFDHGETIGGEFYEHGKLIHAIPPTKSQPAPELPSPASQ
jgi:hypothetical protein